MSKASKFFYDILAETPEYLKLQIDWSWDIAERISNILEQRNMSQRDLARLMGCTQNEVCRWCGGTHNFTLATLAKISVALGEDLISTKVETKQDKDNEPHH